MFVRALREMANPNGSSLQNVERHIRNAYTVDVSTLSNSCSMNVTLSVNVQSQVDPPFMLDELLKAASKKALAKKLATHDGTHTLFKFVQKAPKTPKVKTGSGSINSYFKTSGGGGGSSSKIGSSPLMDDKYEESVSFTTCFHILPILERA